MQNAIMKNLFDVIVIVGFFLIAKGIFGLVLQEAEC